MIAFEFWRASSLTAKERYWLRIYTFSYGCFNKKLATYNNTLAATPKK